METSNASGVPKAWLLFGLSTAGMVVFAALYFATPKNSATGTRASNPAPWEETYEIPEAHTLAMDVYQRLTNATFVKNDGVLFNCKDVRVVYELSDTIKKVVSESEVKAKFELTLRRNNIPLNSNSQNVIYLQANGLFSDGDSQNVLCFLVQCRVYEPVFLFRDGVCRQFIATTWSSPISKYGITQTVKANSEVLALVEKDAEVFANDFLSANPKPK